MRSKRISIVVILILAALAGTGVMIRHVLRSPNFVLLIPDSGAQWIRYDRPMQLGLLPLGRESATFKIAFDVPRLTGNAVLTVRALREIDAISVNGQPIAMPPESSGNWKVARELDIGPWLKIGANELRVVAACENGPVAIQAHATILNLRTGDDWEASSNGDSWSRAVTVDHVTPDALSRAYPSTGESLRRILFALVLVALITFCTYHLLYWRTGGGIAPKDSARYAARARWLILGAWFLLAANNINKLPWYLGFDIQGHMEYLRFIVDHKALPLATDGWQTFQAPFFYILTVLPYAALSQWASEEVVIRALRVIPLLCGALQIELTYRTMRLVFPKRGGLHIIGAVFAACLPMNLYMYQFVSNHALAGVLEAAIVLQTLRLVMTKNDERHRYSYWLLGLTIGFAMLTRVSALIVSVIAVVWVLAAVVDRNNQPLATRLRALTQVALPALAVSGWYFVRNWIALGIPFGLGWDPRLGILWRQDPGYVTPQRLIAFGQSLKQPVYSAYMGPWDAVYSTMWSDGFLSGAPFPTTLPDWNNNFMVASAVLGLFPTAAILAGILVGRRAPNRSAMMFAATVIFTYLAAILWRQLSLPVFSVSKASYMLGLTPCFAILLASGLEPLLRKRWIGSAAWAAFACWAVVAYVAFFVW